VSPLHLALGVITSLVLARAATPINDLDSYWHVEIGRQILTRHTLDGLGTGWLAQAPPHWRTSQWLSEVAMAGTVDAVGWRGLVVARVLLLAAVLVVVMLTLLPRRPVALAVVVTGVTAFGISSFVQDRPQTFSLVFIALLAWSCSRLMTGAGRTHPAAIAAACLVWAQLHPLWILAPVAFGLVTLGAVLDGPGRRAGTVRAGMVSLLASMAGVVSPQGPNAFLLPLRFRAAATQIAEWQATTFVGPSSVMLAILICLCVLAWSRHPRPADRSRLLWLGVWTAFGVTAYRNVAPALLLCAPLALEATDRAWGERVRSWSRPNRPREAALLGTVLAVTLAVGVGWTATRLSRLDPLRSAPARHLAERLAASPSPVRVFNGYNASGSLAAFGGGKVRLVIDGRTDLWGDAYIKKILQAQGLGRGWEATFTGFRPDAVVLPENSPLTVLLLHEGRWRQVAADGDYVLLLPAGTAEALPVGRTTRSVP
jgi:hypothetical protein